MELVSVYSGANFVYADVLPDEPHSLRHGQLRRADDDRVPRIGGRRHGMLDAAMTDLLAMTADGSLKPVAGGRYPLSNVRDAHQDLLARRTTGKLVLDPGR